MPILYGRMVVTENNNLTTKSILSVTPYSNGIMQKVKNSGLIGEYYE